MRNLSGPIMGLVGPIGVRSREALVARFKFATEEHDERLLRIVEPTGQPQYWDTAWRQ